MADVATQNENTLYPKEQSIFFAILVPMLLLLMAEVILFLAVLGASGIVSRLNDNDCVIMDKQVETRHDYLQSYFQSMPPEVLTLATSTNAVTQKLLDEGKISLETIDSDPSQAALIVREAIEPTIAALRGCNSSSAYIIFNTHDLSGKYRTGDFGRKTGLYIRDMDPAGTPSSRNEDLLLECASTEIVREFTIATGSEWQPTFNFAQRLRDWEFDVLYRPWQTAYDAKESKDASEYLYWGVALMSTDGSQQPMMTLSLPLILNDGTVYGVVGIDLSSEYLKTLLPYDELIRENDGAYMLAYYTEPEGDGLANDGGKRSAPLQTQPVVYAGFYAIDNAEYGRTFTVQRTDDSFSAHTMGGQYYVTFTPFTFYNSNTPFEKNRWALLGIVSNSVLHSFSDQVIMMIGLATLLLMLAGLIGSILLGRSISNPIRKLSREVTTASVESSDVIQLGSTGITEVDQLTKAISRLSADVASARRLEQERIEYERDFDLLTGLMNRRAFYRRAEEIFADPDTLKHAAIVMLDLDNLKALNDGYGHDCGDKYIFQAARCFDDAVPDNVLVARVSGDEFFLLFYGYETREQLDADIETLRVAIPNTEFTLPDGKKTAIEASGGVALYLEDSEEFTELMKLADFTMYQVKATGKNNIAYFDMDTYRRTTSALRSIAEFDAILNDFQLVTYFFQPMFDVHTGKPFAYEALLRVSLEALRSPGDVLTLARQEKRMMEVERMTWMRSLECYQKLLAHQQVDPEARLFINSYANLTIEADELAQIAHEYRALMHKVVIEITESEDMDDQATQVKRQIPGFSGQFALDDYGSGYNSELMLLSLRPTYVKVDISIIRNVNASNDKQRIVSHIVEYAHERDMKVIAEGVETPAELETLIDLGVDLAQGFFLAVPAQEPQLISDEALAIIQARSGHSV